MKRERSYRPLQGHVAAVGETMSSRIVECASCQGDGFIYRQGVVYEAGCGHPHMGEVCEGLCPACHGSCVEEIEAEPRTLADLEDEDFDMLEAKA